MAKYTADQIADTLIALARERNLEISNLKLQKLLYYAQAWNLVFTNEELFDEDIEAWVHGPVVPKVFRRFKSFQWKTIDEPVTPLADAKVRSHLEEVLNVYGHFNARQLERLTHSEAPWRDARKGLAPDESGNTVISRASMKSFYEHVANGKE